MMFKIRFKFLFLKLSVTTKKLRLNPISKKVFHRFFHRAVENFKKAKVIL